MSHKKILIADDDPGIVLMLKTRLIKQGYEIISAVDGLECLQLVKKEKPDLIIMDILMPQMDGHQAVEKIRGMGGVFQKIPIIVISVKEDLAFLFDGLGIEVYMPKPFDADELVQRVNHVLNLRRS